MKGKKKMKVDVMILNDRSNVSKHWDNHPCRFCENFVDHNTCTKGDMLDCKDLNEWKSKLKTIK